MSSCSESGFKRGCCSNSGFHWGSDAANFDYKAYPELAAGENRISVKSKLPHLASILDGHFVAGY